MEKGLLFPIAPHNDIEWAQQFAVQWVNWWWNCQRNAKDERGQKIHHLYVWTTYSDVTFAANRFDLQWKQRCRVIYVPIYTIVHMKIYIHNCVTYNFLPLHLFDLRLSIWLWPILYLPDGVGSFVSTILFMCVIICYLRLMRLASGLLCCRSPSGIELDSHWVSVREREGEKRNRCVNYKIHCQPKWNT